MTTEGMRGQIMENQPSFLTGMATIHPPKITSTSGDL